MFQTISNFLKETFQIPCGHWVLVAHEKAAKQGLWEGQWLELCHQCSILPPSVSGQACRRRHWPWTAARHRREMLGKSSRTCPHPIDRPQCKAQNPATCHFFSLLRWGIEQPCLCSHPAMSREKKMRTRTNNYNPNPKSHKILHLSSLERA